jgi:molecular chaperone GrpE (heat shock protein)
VAEADNLRIRARQYRTMAQEASNPSSAMNLLGFARELERLAEALNEQKPMPGEE